VEYTCAGERGGFPRLGPSLPLSVERNLALPLLTLGLGPVGGPARAGQLPALGRGNEQSEPAGGLAFRRGQQQRLCLTRVPGPGVKTCTSGQTHRLPGPYQAAAGGEDLLLSLAGGYALVVFFHDLGQARMLANRVAICARGVALGSWPGPTCRAAACRRNFWMRHFRCR
jgi:hypothetical protein